MAKTCWTLAVIKITSCPPSRRARGEKVPEEDIIGAVVYICLVEGSTSELSIYNEKDMLAFGEFAEEQREGDKLPF